MFIHKIYLLISNQITYLEYLYEGGSYWGEGWTDRQTDRQADRQPGR